MLASDKGRAHSECIICLCAVTTGEVGGEEVTPAYAFERQGCICHQLCLLWGIMRQCADSVAMMQNQLICTATPWLLCRWLSSWQATHHMHNFESRMESLEQSLGSDHKQFEYDHAVSRSSLYDKEHSNGQRQSARFWFNKTCHRRPMSQDCNCTAKQYKRLKVFQNFDLPSRHSCLKSSV